MPVDIVLGLQRGDEGKGRIVDLLAGSYDIVARFNGGPNAGHTVACNNVNTLRLHQLPSGIARPGIMNVLGNGMLVDPIRLSEEIRDVQAMGVKVSPSNLVLSDLAHLILPHHISLDEIREAGKGGQGSTKRGIAYVARDKYERVGIRAETIVCDLDRLRSIVKDGLEAVNNLRKSVGLPVHDSERESNKWITIARKLVPYITDTVSLVQAALGQNKFILAEGAQAFGLDIEFGMYPFVTSSHTTSGGAINGLGIDPHQVKRVIGVVKVFKSHVGGGPFVTEITDKIFAEKIRGQRGSVDGEFGVSTGRERKVGFLDLPELRRAIAVNGVTEIVLTKFDILNKYSNSLPVATVYKLGVNTLDKAPSSAAQLEKCVPEYRNFPLWDKDISKIRKVVDLPKTARILLDFLAGELGVPITMIGVGPEREQIILS